MCKGSLTNMILSTTDSVNGPARGRLRRGLWNESLTEKEKDKMAYHDIRFLSLCRKLLEDRLEIDDPEQTIDRDCLGTIEFGSGIGTEDWHLGGDEVDSQFELLNRFVDLLEQLRALPENEAIQRLTALSYADWVRFVKNTGVRKMYSSFARRRPPDKEGIDATLLGWGLTRGERASLNLDRLFDALKHEKQRIGWAVPKLAKFFDHKEARDVHDLWINPPGGLTWKRWVFLLRLAGISSDINDPVSGERAHPGAKSRIWSASKQIIVDPTTGTDRNPPWGWVDKHDNPDDPTSRLTQVGMEGAINRMKVDLLNEEYEVADRIAEEELEHARRRGELDRSSVYKALGNGLFQHLTEAERIRKENEWVRNADLVERERAARAARAFRSYSTGNATSSILRGHGEGWSNDPQTEANRMIEVAWLCQRGDAVAAVARRKFFTKDYPNEVHKDLLKAYVEGKISPRELQLDGEFHGEGDVDSDVEVIQAELNRLGWTQELDYLIGEEYQI